MNETYKIIDAINKHRKNLQKYSPFKKIVLFNLSGDCIGCSSHSKLIRGRPVVFIKGKQERLSRLVYQWKFGEIPKNMYVCHSCDNPECVNISHLFLGTCQDNRSDCVNKKRHCFGEKHGRHKLTEEQVKEIRKLREILTFKNYQKITYKTHPECRGKQGYYIREYTISKLSKIYNISEKVIGQIVRKEIWKMI